MHFSRRDQFFQASRITGPTHNLLALSFGEQHDAAAPTIEALPPVGACRHAPLDPQQIFAAVLDGVDMANMQFGVQFGVQRVQYVENDTGPERMYGVLAIKLIEHLVGGGTFEPARAVSDHAI